MAQMTMNRAAPKASGDMSLYSDLVMVKVLAQTKMIATAAISGMKGVARAGLAVDSVGEEAVVSAINVFRIDTNL